MSIRSRVYLIQVVIAVAVASVALVVLVTVRSTNDHLNRLGWANQQLEAITSLRVSANRFSEQIAELLLIGEAELPDLESARTELEAGFDHLEKVTRGAGRFQANRSGREDGLDEIHRIDRMRAIYQQINQSVARVLALHREGRQADAIAMFRDDIENRLDAEFEHLLAAAALDEREEVLGTERDAEALWQRLTLATSAAAAIVIAVCIVSGHLLARSLTRPIDLLIHGTEAIGRGELGHRIPFDGSDELGILARRFNQMAAVQEQQHTMLRHSHLELERQVAERTHELEVANRRLTSLDRMRVQFLADISHELRTPLAGLRGEAEVTLRHGTKPEGVYRDTLQRIVAYASDLARLVEDLLFLARSETDTVRFDLQRVNLQDVLGEAIREGEVLGRSKNIGLEQETVATPIPIEVDRQRFKQALLIIFDNAIKFSRPNQSVMVTVAASSQWGEITVRDEGMGIPAEELPQVFERYFRGRISRTTDQSGSGLGLAIAKWLVEKQGGELTLESEEGRFTQVRIRVPRTEIRAVA